MSYKVIVFDEKVFSSDFSKLSKKEAQLIIEKINWLKKDWIKNAQVKRLKNYPVADFRLRVWNYRILFNYDLTKKEIYLFRILHRSKLY